MCSNTISNLVLKVGAEDEIKEVKEKDEMRERNQRIRMVKSLLFSSKNSTVQSVLLYL